MFLSLIPMVILVGFQHYLTDSVAATGSKERALAYRPIFERKSLPVSDELRLKMLAPRPGIVRAVLDTDTYNEIDDQFALVQMILSPERI